MTQPATPPAAALRAPGFRGLLATAFTVALGFGLIVPALPAFARDLGASYSATSAVVAVFAAVRLVSATPAGTLADRTGARRTIALGLLIVALSSGATALAQSYPQLLVLRGLGGAGSAMFIVGIGQHIVLTVPVRERGRANGLLQGSFLLGGASGPAVGGVLVELTGIRTPFAIYGALLLVATVVALRFIGTESSPQPGTARPTPVEREASRAAVRRMLTDRTVLGALLLALAVNYASQGLRFFAIPLFGEEVLQMSAGGIGAVLTAASVSHAAVLYPASRRLDRVGRRPNARIGAALYVVSLLGLVTTTSVPVLVLWMVVQGVATGIVSAVPSAVVGDLAPAGAAGRAMGVLGVARDVGAVSGAQLSGVLADVSGFGVTFAAAGGLLAVAFAATLGMRETVDVEHLHVPADDDS